MPFKSSTKTLKKKSLKNTQKKKSGTAKRSKNRSRKGGAKTKKTPSPESSGEDTDNYEIPEDLPSPEEYTDALMKKDEKYVDAVMKAFYNKDKPHAAITKLKKMKTDTKAERLEKKKSLVKAPPSLIPLLPKAVEKKIFQEINKRIQVELDNYAEKKKIRDEKFEKIINDLEDKRFNADHDYIYYHNKINEMDKLWKPDEHYELDHLETAIYGEDPFLEFEQAKTNRIRYVETYIRDSWDKGWRESVKDYKPNSGRKLTDILIEDWLVPRCVDDYYGATYDEGYGDFSYSDEMYMINDWNKTWIKANDDEYIGSDEQEKDKKAKENAKTAADEKKAENAVSEKKGTKLLLLRARRKKAAEKEAANRKRTVEETGMLPEPPAQKIRATPMPPAAGDGPTPMTSTESAPISYTDAQKLANENEHIIIVQSKSNPGESYMFNNETKVSTWIIGNPPSGLYQSTKTPGQYYSINKQGTAEWLGTNEFSRVDAENAVQNNPGRFEIRTHNTPDGNFDYLINKETDAVAKILD